MRHLSGVALALVLLLAEGDLVYAQQAESIFVEFKYGPDKTAQDLRRVLGSETETAEVLAKSCRDSNVLGKIWHFERHRRDTRPKLVVEVRFRVQWKMVVWLEPDHPVAGRHREWWELDLVEPGYLDLHGWPASNEAPRFFDARFRAAVLDTTGGGELHDAFLRWAPLLRHPCVVRTPEYDLGAVIGLPWTKFGTLLGTSCFKLWYKLKLDDEDRLIEVTSRGTNRSHQFDRFKGIRVRHETYRYGNEKEERPAGELRRHFRDNAMTPRIVYLDEIRTLGGDSDLERLR